MPRDSLDFQVTLDFQVERASLGGKVYLELLVHLGGRYCLLVLFAVYVYVCVVLSMLTSVISKSEVVSSLVIASRF